MPRARSKASATTRGTAIGALVLGLTLPVPVAQADEGRFQDYAVGGRAMGLGGAFTAISDDASGIFYNPAGIVDVGRARLSLSTSLYGLELHGTTPVEGVAQRLDRGITATDLIIIPSSTGAVIGLGEPLPGGHRRHAVAFGTLVPSYTSRYVETVLEDRETGAPARFRSQLTDRTLHAGVAYAYRPGPWLRVGLALHYVLRTVDAQDDLASPYAPGESERFFHTSTRLRATQHSVRAALGVKLRPGPRWSLGLSVTPPSLGVWRAIELESETVDARDAGATPKLARASARLSGFDATSHLPAKARVGVAFQEPGDFTVSFDVIGYAPSSYVLLRPEEIAGDRAGYDRIPIPLRVDRGPLVNAAFGVEKLLSNDIALAAGVFTNLSSADTLVVNAGGLLARDSPRLSNVHMVGASLAVGFFQEHSLHRLGVTGSTGFGKIVVPAAPEPDAIGAPPLRALESTQTFVYVFWSSSFRYGDGRDTRALDL